MQDPFTVAFQDKKVGSRYSIHTGRSWLCLKPRKQPKYTYNGNKYSDLCSLEHWPARLHWCLDIYWYGEPLTLCDPLSHIFLLWHYGWPPIPTLLTQPGHLTVKYFIRGHILMPVDPSSLFGAELGHVTRSFAISVPDQAPISLNRHPPPWIKNGMIFS